MRVLRRFLCLPLHDRLLLVSAVLVLGAVGAALRLVSFKKLLRWADEFSHKSYQGQKHFSPSSERITWAISAVGGRIPFLSRCLVQAVATKILLTRCGYPALVRIGVTRGETGQLEAHAWVESQGAIVMGSPAADRFVPLAGINRGSR
jgi:hypothetical protein